MYCKLILCICLCLLFWGSGNSHATTTRKLQYTKITDKYFLVGKGIKIDVTILNPRKKGGKIKIVSIVEQKKYHQYLTLPRELWLDGINDNDRSIVLLWEPNSVKFLVILLNSGEGTGGERNVMLYYWKKHVWTLFDSNENKYEFSDRGSFYTSKNHLFIWDFVYDEDYAHSAPAKYKLRQFTWDGKFLIGPVIKITKRRYPTFDDYIPDVILPKNDPLREFGMRWRWWSPLISSKH